MLLSARRSDRQRVLLIGTGSRHLMTRENLSFCGVCSPSTPLSEGLVDSFLIYWVGARLFRL